MYLFNKMYHEAYHRCATDVPQMCHIKNIYKNMNIKTRNKNINKRLLRAKKLRGGTTIFLTAFSLLLVNWKVRFIPEFASYAINCFSGNFQKRYEFKSQNRKSSNFNSYGNKERNFKHTRPNSDVRCHVVRA